MTNTQPPPTPADLPSSHPTTQPPNHPTTFFLLDRPDEQRLREHKYRFSQTVVFGLPVIVLQVYGRALGGPESERWVAVLQALLAGWVAYVAATGMLFEGIVILMARRRTTGDLLVAVASIVLYGFGVVSVLHLPLTGHLGYRPLLFHVVVTLLAIWTGSQWWRWSRRLTSTSSVESRLSHPPPAA